MRLLSVVIAAAVALPGLALAAESPEVEAALQQVRGHMRVEKGVNFRKLKLTPAGDLCGTVSRGGDRDTEFLFTKASGQIWVAEGEREEQSLFNYGDAAVKRSTERDDYKAWKACAKG